MLYSNVSIGNTTLILYLVYNLYLSESKDNDETNKTKKNIPKNKFVTKTAADLSRILIVLCKLSALA